jgi:hypothetical protein
MQPRDLFEAKDGFERRVLNIIEEERAFLEEIGQL